MVKTTKTGALDKMDEPIRTKNDLLNDIFDKIKEDKDIKSIVLIGYGGFTAQSCGYLEQYHTDISSGHGHNVVQLANGFVKQIKDGYNVSEILYRIEDENCTEEDESIYLIFTKLDDMYILLTKYSGDNSDYPIDTIKNIHKYIKYIKNVLND